MIGEDGGGENLLVASGDIAEFNRPSSRPFRWWLLGLGCLVFGFGVRSERFDTRYASDMGFNLGPECQEELDTLAEENHI